MSGTTDRLLRLCLLAYPRVVRERDAGELTALAAELAAEHGTAREAWGLLRGGWGERRRRATRRRRVTTALVAATAAVLALATWSATAQPTRVEVERFGCAGDCATTESRVAALVDGGWTCDETREPSATTWRCTLD